MWQKSVTISELGSYLSLAYSRSEVLATSHLILSVLFGSEMGDEGLATLVLVDRLPSVTAVDPAILEYRFPVTIFIPVNLCKAPFLHCVLSFTESIARAIP
jgi:hypothetical protein